MPVACIFCTMDIPVNKEIDREHVTQALYGK